MLIDPEMYKEMLVDAKLPVLINARDELIGRIRDYEDTKRRGYDMDMIPDPFSVYENDCLCLIEVLRLICDKIDYESFDKELLEM